MVAPENLDLVVQVRVLTGQYKRITIHAAGLERSPAYELRPNSEQFIGRVADLERALPQMRQSERKAPSPDWAIYEKF